MYRFAVTLTILVLSALPGLAQTVAFITDRALPVPAQHGITVLQEALKRKGLTIRNGRDAGASSTYVILAGLSSGGGAAGDALKTLNVPLPKGAEALAIRREGRLDGRRALVLVGSDGIGLMYAALEVAERISWAEGADPFEAVKDVSEAPYLRVRAVSMYTMNRAYWESRLYDQEYWKKYFDTLAADRFNQFTIQFGFETGGFLAPMYPYFFDTPGWPNVKMTGMTPELQEKNLAALNFIVRAAHERGIKLLLGGWDHIDRGATVGAEGQRFGRVNVPGGVDQLVTGLDQGNLAAYTKAAIVRLTALVPDADGYQWRILDEAGIPNSIQVPFWEDVFKTVKGLGKTTEIRAKGVNPVIYEDSHAMGLDFLVNTKYWMEQLGMPFHPMHINRQNQGDVRHGYADLLKYPKTYQMQWQIWTGGTTRLLLWGDPTYTRRVALSARIYDGDAVEINEILATKMYGDHHTDAKPLPILTEPYRTYTYEFERYWHYYRSWGRLLYNPDTEPSVWSHEFVQRFGSSSGPHIERALELASNVLPRIVAASYLYRGFPTTVGWAEMMRQGNLPTYAAQEEGSDVQLFENVREAAARLNGGTETAMVKAEDTSRWFAETSSTILAELAAARKAAGPARNAELEATAADLGVLAGLARFHSERLLGGIEYNLYKLNGDLSAFDKAVAHEQRGVQAWTDMVVAAGDVFSPELSFGLRNRFPRHWSAELAALKTDYQQLVAERAAAVARPGAKVVQVPLFDPKTTPPAATLSRVPMAEVGRDMAVSVSVAAPAGVKSVHLRYRHLNQTEDYRTADMTLDPATGKYAGAIPAAFIDPKWDIMYFVEVIDRSGVGRMFPDFEVEAPYVVVPVRR